MACLSVWQPAIADYPPSPAFHISQFLNSGGTGWNEDAIYNPKYNEYFVVWSYVTDSKPFIYGQRIDADTGALKGDRIVLSSSDFHWAYQPDVAYNSVRDEYMVVFAANAPAAVTGKRYEREIYAQRVNAATGIPVFGNIRISDVGFEEDPAEPGRSLEANDPAIVYNAKENHYLVVWWGDEVYNKGTSQAPDYYFEWEVFGQFISGDSGTLIGANDFRISFHGPQGINNYFAKFPSVVLNPAENHYLVTWAFSEYMTGAEPGIYGRRIHANTRAFLETSEFRIDTPGQAYSPPDAPTFTAVNSRDNQYLVTWVQRDGTLDKSVRNGNEIFSQRLDGKTGVKIGERVRLSTTGTEGDSGESAFFGAVAYNPFRHQYIVVWDADPSGGFHFIYGQAVDANTGRPVRSHDFLMSDVKALTSIPGLGTHIEPFISMNSTKENFLIGWIAWDLEHEKIGVWGQVNDAARVDGMNTQPTPTPTPSPTPTFIPPGNPNSGAQGDLRAALTKVKKPKNSYVASCLFNGTGQAAYSLAVYRSTDKTLDAKDKVIARSSGVLGATSPVAVGFKAKPQKKPAFLIARCVPASQIIDAVPKNNVLTKKLPKS